MFINNKYINIYIMYVINNKYLFISSYYKIYKLLIYLKQLCRIDFKFGLMN